MLSKVHPELERAHQAFLSWVEREKHFGIAVREITRTPTEHVERNLAEIEFQLALWKSNHWAFSPNQANRAEQLNRMGAEGRRREAARRFSWHLVGCAVTYDTGTAAEASDRAAREWWETRYPKPLWSVVQCHPAYSLRGRRYFTVERHDYWRRKEAVQLTRSI